MVGKSAQGDATGRIVAYFDSAFSPVPSGAANVANISEVQWRDSVANPGKYQVVDNVFGLALAPTAAQLNAQGWAARQAQARAALADSDITMHRISEAVALGNTAWTAPDVVTFMQWRRQLRAILSQAQPSTIPSALPTKPAYPAGT